MKSTKHKGFTLLEMIVVLGIFGIMTSITVFNYSKFRSQTVLTNMAYEVALSVREAQIYGVSVRNPNGINASQGFSYPYGINFIEGSSTYNLFADSFGGGNGRADCSENECVTPYTMQRNIFVSGLRKKINSTCTDVTELNVMYRRPSPETIFDNLQNAEFAEVEILAPDGDLRYILIRSNGQIEVKGNSEC